MEAVSRNGLNYGDGSVFQRNDGRWIGTLEAGWTEKGNRRRVYVTGPGCVGGCAEKCPHVGAIKRKLRNKRDEVTKANGQTTSGAASRKTVKSWADEWIEIRRTTVRPKTYEGDLSALRWIIPTIGTKRLVDLSPRDVRAVAARERAAGNSPASLLRTFRKLVKMLRDAVEEGYHVPSSLFDIKAMPQAETDREALETVQAVAVMHHAADLPCGRGSRYFVGFYQGLRQGEALGLTWDAIDFEANTITVEWQLQALPYLDKNDRSKGFRIPDAYTARHLKGRFHLVRPKTKSGYRVIPMVPEIRQALFDLRSVAQPTVGNLVWVRENGWPIDKADDAAEFKALQVAAGVKHPAGRLYTPHEMRNTTATLLLEADVDPVVITAILGHSSWATSARYTKARAERLRAAMEQIAAALKPKELNPGTDAPARTAPAPGE